jgi:hypothetical protein
VICRVISSRLRPLYQFKDVLPRSPVLVGFGQLQHEIGGLGQICQGAAFGFDVR